MIVLLDGSIKTFTVGIHFGGFGVGMSMGYRKFVEEGVEALLEFTAIIGQHFLEWIGVGAMLGMLTIITAMVRLLCVVLVILVVR